jgi:hypothetical protein
MALVALPTDPTWSILGNLLQVVIVFFWQHKHPFMNGLPYMEVHIDHGPPTKARVPNACVRRFGDQTMSVTYLFMRSFQNTMGTRGTQKGHPRFVAPLVRGPK